MIALIGLGNPGEKHSLNRHNIGFIVIDELIDNFFNWKKKNSHI